MQSCVLTLFLVAFYVLSRCLLGLHERGTLGSLVKILVALWCILWFIYYETLSAQAEYDYMTLHCFKLFVPSEQISNKKNALQEILRKRSYKLPKINQKLDLKNTRKFLSKKNFLAFPSAYK